MWMPGSSNAADVTGSSWSVALSPSAASLSDLRRSISCLSSVLMTLSRCRRDDVSDAAAAAVLAAACDERRVDVVLLSLYKH